MNCISEHSVFFITASDFVGEIMQNFTNKNTKTNKHPNKNKQTNKTCCNPGLNWVKCLSRDFARIQTNPAQKYSTFFEPDLA